MAVIDRAANHLPQIGLKLLLELKKTVGGVRAHHQTMISLVLANILSPLSRPIAILTDLRDVWIMYWLDGITIFTYKFDGRAVAAGFVEHFLDDEVTNEIPVLRPSGEEVTTSIAKRQKLILRELDQLDDLKGFLPEEEIFQDRMNVGIKILLQNPVLHALSLDAPLSSELAHMYS